jgi:hypothetical protein
MGHSSRSLKMYEGQFSPIQGECRNDFYFQVLNTPWDTRIAAQVVVDMPSINKGWEHLPNGPFSNIDIRDDFNGKILHHKEIRGSFMGFGGYADIDTEIDFTYYPQITVIDNLKRISCKYTREINGWRGY